MCQGNVGGLLHGDLSDHAFDELRWAVAWAVQVFENDVDDLYVCRQLLQPDEQALLGQRIVQQIRIGVAVLVEKRVGVDEATHAPLHAQLSEPQRQDEVGVQDAV